MAEPTREVEYKAYIDLAGRTVALLAGLPKAEGEERLRHRMLAKNLCAFQDRWATPLDTPFEGIGSDLEQRLETPRDWQALASLSVAFPVGESYCLVNDEQWAAQVATGGLAGEAATGVKETFADWMADLFHVLAGAPEKQREEARRLAACWYYHATETTFDDEVEEEDAAATKVAAKTKTLIDQLLFGQEMPVSDGEDDEDDEEFVPGEEDGEDDDEEEEEEEEHDDEADLQEVETKWVTRDMELATRDEAMRRKYANKHKQLGNNLFKEQELNKCLEQFSRAIYLLTELDEAEEEEEEDAGAKEEEEEKAEEKAEEEEEEETPSSCLSKAAQAELAILYGNRAAIFQKLGIWERVANDATKAIDLNPLYTKALLRRAQAYEELEYFEEALEDFEAVLGLAPDSNVARLAVQRLRILLSEDEDGGGITADMMQGALKNMLKKAAEVRSARDQEQLAQGVAVPTAEMAFEESEKARAIRETIVAAVQALGAHSPDAEAFPVHHLRMQEKRTAAQSSGSAHQLAWFPLLAASS